MFISLVVVNVCLSRLFGRLEMFSATCEVKSSGTIPFL